MVNITENIVVIAEETAAGTSEMAASSVDLSSGMESYTEKSGRLTRIASELKDAVGKFELTKEVEMSQY